MNNDSPQSEDACSLLYHCAFCVVIVLLIKLFLLWQFGVCIHRDSMTEHGSYFAIRINSSISITKQLHSFHLSQHFKKSFVRDLDWALEAWYLLDLGFINFSSTGPYITKQVHCIRQLSLCSDSLQLWEFQSIQRFLISYSEKTCSSVFFPINLTQKPFIQSKILDQGIVLGR